MNEMTVETKTIYAGKILTLRRDKVLLDNGNTTHREIVEHPGAACILPVQNGYITLVQQFRKPIEKSMIEIPAGKLELGENPETSAIRELSEETGLNAKAVTYLGSFYTSPGFSNEIMHSYLATDFFMDKASPDEDELLNIVKLSVGDFAAMVTSLEISDAKTLLTYYLAVAKYPQAFASHE